MVSSDLAQDENYMRRCIELGRAASRKGESPVGSLVVRDGRVIAEASEGTKGDFDVTAHAEVLAIRGATHAARSTDLSGCTLYTNVEPCVLCSYAIRKTRIDRVVIGVPTSALGGLSSTYPILRDTETSSFGAPPAITQGVLASEIEDLFKSHKSGRTPQSKA